ncbi:MAG: hypothetical protein GX275_12390 [Clostridiales bacterium]|nr:hypothetical protein [Clostridiales bacterium]
MKYIGPFFRMNTLSIEDIKGQLFHLSKEAIKTIALSSKCGITTSFRASKKSHSNNDINTLNDFSPLLCIYKKSSPTFIHSKSSCSFNEETFKKNILPMPNAMLTLCILELSNYYSNYSIKSNTISSFEKPYIALAKRQLDFFSKNLRNTEGIFVEKKNSSESNTNNYTLIEEDNSFSFSDQSFMMVAYFLFSLYYEEESVSSEYREFSIQILNMLLEFKDSLYDVSFDEGTKILMSLNILYSYYNEESLKKLIIDYSDFLIDKFNDKDYINSEIDNTSILAITLIDSYNNTGILSFKDKSDEIINKLISFYISDTGIFTKDSDKKEIKYSSEEIIFYFLAILIYDNKEQFTSKSMISSLYRNLIVNSGIVASWPDAPTLDEIERYKYLSLRSNDMLDELFFRMPNLQSPNSTGIAPVFYKNVIYSVKKKRFSTKRNSFDSSKNMMIFYVLIHYLKNDVASEMHFTEITENTENND